VRVSAMLTVTLHMQVSKPAVFALHLRIPAWAGRQTSVSVNGKRQKAAPAPGAFVALLRKWKTGDRVELDLDQPARTEAVDVQNGDQVAVLRGPQVLFAISTEQPEIPGERLARLRLEKADNDDWTLSTGESALRLRPFASIGEEVYQTYCRVLPA